MVNGGMVNARASYFPPPLFADFSAFLGPILRFQNPLKYIRNF